jgi:hypothetical protein
MPRFNALKISAGRYCVVSDHEGITVALSQALPDLDIFQATCIVDALSLDETTIGDKLVAIIDRHIA